MIRLVRVRTDTSQSQAEDLTHEAALECLISGQCILSDDQNLPPFLVLDHLAFCLTDIERFGPAATETTELDWVAKNLFANNVRQNVIVGDKLDWYEGSTRLIRAAGDDYAGPMALDLTY